MGRVVTPLNQFLSSDGQGGGTISLNVNGSISAVTHSITPQTNEVYEIDRLVFTIESLSALLVGGYGHLAALVAGTGTLLRVRGGNPLAITYDILAGTELLEHNHFNRFGTGDRTLGSANLIHTGIMDMPRSADGRSMVLHGGNSDTLEVVVRADLSTLTGHYFLAQGRKITSTP